jgi:RNA polymerase sigma-70 factor (ECF subfamily)
MLADQPMEEAVPESDHDLLRQMMSGDERGFVCLYRKYQQPVYRFCLQISGSGHIAEEVTQETFLVMIRAPQKYDAGRGPLLLYLFGIARHLVRRSRKRDQLFTSLEDGWETLVAGRSDVLGDVARCEQFEQVRQAILALPRKYREVIVLCALQELTYEEAASVVRCSIGTVRSRMHRARQLLIRKLKKSRVAEAVAQNASILRCEL